MAQIIKHHLLNDLGNQGLPYDERLFIDKKVNTSAVERRCVTGVKRRSVKRATQAAWLLKAISCIDLTTLSGDDTSGRVRRLCAKAKSPIKASISDALQISGLNL